MPTTLPVRAAAIGRDRDKGPSLLVAVLCAWAMVMLAVTAVSPLGAAAIAASIQP